jgi:glycerol-3-phosphate dehydrogenase
MAEQAIDQVVRWLNKIELLNNSRGSCRTGEEMILPPSETKGISGIVPPKFEREIITHFCSNEWAVHLDDLMIRRTSWHYYFRYTQARAEQVADWMADVLGWTQEKRTAELTRYDQLRGV